MDEEEDDDDDEDDGTDERGPYGVSASGASTGLPAPCCASASRHLVRILRRTARNAPKTNTYTTITSPNMIHKVVERVAVTASATRMFW